MSGHNRVIWSEGMFLRPQHFQQHDRFIENYVNGRCGRLQPYDWGFHTLRIDPKQLSMGKFALIECKGIFPDGTPFNLPGDDELPLPIEIPTEIHNNVIFLAVPVSRPGSVEVDREGHMNKLARYHAEECEVMDNNSGADSSSPVLVGKLRAGLMLERQERAGHVCLGVARVIESRVDKNVILDEEYIPPTLNCNVQPRLNSFIKELCGLLNTRGEALAARVSEAGRGGVAEVADFMLLQLVNRYQPLFEHLQNVQGLHPENLYRIAVTLAGDLSTFTRPGKRPVSFPPYVHDDLRATFAPVMDDLRQSLSLVLEQNAIAIPLSAPKYGIRAAKITDHNLLRDAVFVLAVNAQVPAETLRNYFPTQVKIGPVEQIQQLVRSALPGINVTPLPVAPRQIPYHAGFVYFELNKHSEMWKQLFKSGGFAIHVGGEFPGLELEFWAIKKG